MVKLADTRPLLANWPTEVHTILCKTCQVVPPPRARRLTQLYVGLVLYGVSDGTLPLAGLGVDPWDVFHQGLSRQFGLGVGTVGH